MKINGVEHGLFKWLGYSEKFNEWMLVKETENVLKISYI